MKMTKTEIQSATGVLCISVHVTFDEGSERPSGGSLSVPICLD
jgi:hypothetical protein